MRLARIATPAGPRHVVADGADWVVVEDVFARPLVRTDERHPQAGARLLAPVEPRVVLGMAHNSGPADRQLPPQAFMKSARTVVGPGDPVRIDPRRGEVKVEGELTLVVRRECRNLTPEDVPDAVLGWTVGNDVTAVDQTPLDEKMTQAKNGDGFTPIGPWIETDLDPRDVAIDVDVDGVRVASSSSAGLAWDVVEQLVYLTSHLTLGPGDVILTGSPGTAATVRAGDRSDITLSGIGTLSNPIV
ncbi:fumarylacetoacetate hydrolase family protein [Georgenia sp. SYP-B2076]|uniref:fumarylacetoacetate hydrolase family protein n=1 Tax=Georgenia sp. SYP-B2076 TaxID=2495881 RepID=UPI000F8E4734|nr:fumarylacetoacetate hydrolase family protein [Georgenia sp. SYP-B2076]